MGGRLVGGLAVALHRLGVRVSGVDDAPWPEVVALLARHGLALGTHPHAAGLPDGVELVLAGAIATPQRYPAWKTALARGIPVQEPTQFLEQTFLRCGDNVVVVGTKGKTTTTAMLAWIARETGTAADHLFGGTVPGLDSVALEFHPLRILEGDEYPRSVTDSRTKFSGYHARHLVLTNLRHDHRDIYPTAAAYRAVFAEEIARLPANGSLHLPDDDAAALAWAEASTVPHQTVGWSARATTRLSNFCITRSGSRFALAGTPFQLRVPGRFNAQNAAFASVAAQAALGVDREASAAALATFPGVLGRLQPLPHAGNRLLYRDDGYLPFALTEVLQALRQQHPRRALTLCFQPRYTATNLPWGPADREASAPTHGATHGEDLATALSLADQILVIPPSPLVPEDQGFDADQLVAKLRALGKSSSLIEASGQLPDAVARRCPPGAAVLLSLGLDQWTLVEQIRLALRQDTSHPSSPA